MCALSVDIRPATLIQLRRGVLRVKKQLPPANVTGLKDFWGQGEEVSWEGISLLSMAAQAGGLGPRAEKVALESLNRTRLKRTPHTKYKDFLGPLVDSTGRALAVSVKCSKRQTTNSCAH